MRLTRGCDNAILRLYKQGKMVGGAYTGKGNEATAVGSAFALEKHDYIFPLHRDLGAHLVKGPSLGPSQSTLNISQVAIIAAEVFERLDAPVQRVAAKDTPVPYGPRLEAAMLPQESDVVAALERLVKY